MLRTTPQRRLSRRGFALLALALGAVACKVSVESTSSETTVPAPAAGSGLAASGAPAATPGRVVSTTKSQWTSWTVNGRTRVSIVVDDHPKIDRTFDVPVDVKTDKSVAEGVTRTVVTIKKKDADDVLEVINL